MVYKLRHSLLRSSSSSSSSVARKCRSSLEIEDYAFIFGPTRDDLAVKCVCAFAFLSQPTGSGSQFGGDTAITGALTAFDLFV